jgi:hypothetical protein
MVRVVFKDLAQNVQNNRELVRATIGLGWLTRGLYSIQSLAFAASTVSPLFQEGLN